MTLLPVGVGLGWRPETALLVERREDLAFSEVIAELVDPKRPPPALAAAVERGLPVVTHGVGLDLGGAHGAARARVQQLVRVARTLRSPLVSEHVAFCRTPAHESAHFLPVPRTRPQLALLVEHVRRVQDALPVPFALENVAAPITWPGDELAEADFLAELIDRTGALLLLDASNVHANLVNHGGDLGRYLARLPLERVAYMHAAGGARIAETGMYRDTHAHALDAAVVHTLAQILARTGPVPLLLERDAHHDLRLDAELDGLAAVLAAAPDPIAPPHPPHAPSVPSVPSAPSVPPAPPAPHAPSVPHSPHAPHTPHVPHAPSAPPVPPTPPLPPAPHAPHVPPVLLALPVVDRALREHLAARHTLLLDTLASTSSNTNGFDAQHLAETRAILGNKRTRRARPPGALLR